MIVKFKLKGCFALLVKQKKIKKCFINLGLLMKETTTHHKEEFLHSQQVHVGLVGIIHVYKQNRNLGIYKAL